MNEDKPDQKMDDEIIQHLNSLKDQFLNNEAVAFMMQFYKEKLDADQYADRIKELADLLEEIPDWHKRFGENDRKIIGRTLEVVAKLYQKAKQEINLENHEISHIEPKYDYVMYEFFNLLKKIKSGDV